MPIRTTVSHSHSLNSRCECKSANELLTVSISLGLWHTKKASAPSNETLINWEKHVSSFFFDCTKFSASRNPSLNNASNRQAVYLLVRDAAWIQPWDTTDQNSRVNNAPQRAVQANPACTAQNVAVTIAATTSLHRRPDLLSGKWTWNHTRIVAKLLEHFLVAQPIKWYKYFQGIHESMNEWNTQTLYCVVKHVMVIWCFISLFHNSDVGGGTRWARNSVSSTVPSVHLQDAKSRYHEVSLSSPQQPRSPGWGPAAKCEAITLCDPWKSDLTSKNVCVKLTWSWDTSS